MTTTTMERLLIGYLLGESTPTPALRVWLATPTGKAALAAHRRVLRGVDAWGAAVVRKARRRGPADERTIYYGTLTTPLGPVLAAVGDRGLVGVSFGRAARTFGRTLARREHAHVVRADDRLARVRSELAEYLAGTRRRFALRVDLGSVSPFQRRVLDAARTIPRGTVLSYGEIARRIGQPGASRAVGQALGRNPVPIVIPCHRVVAGGGRLGGYVGGPRIKQRLLALEGARHVVMTQSAAGLLASAARLSSTTAPARRKSQ